MTLPQQLTSQTRWVLWRADKLPCQTSGRLASSTDRATWTTYQTALAAAPRFRGLGFVLGDGLAGVDLDHCLDAEGRAAQWALQIVARLNSYTEVSPSGTGLHVFLLGVLPGPSRKTPEVEVYGGGRYFTVTGNHWPGTPTTVERRQVQLAEWYRERFPVEVSDCRQVTPPAELDATDAELLAAAFASRTGTAIMALFNEPGAPGNSEGDASLCAKLSFYSGGDPARLERFMRHSARYREKWDTRRGQDTWIGQECKRAIARHSGDWFRPRRQREGGVPIVTGQRAYSVG